MGIRKPADGVGHADVLVEVHEHIDAADVAVAQIEGQVGQAFEVLELIVLTLLSLRVSVRLVRLLRSLSGTMLLTVVACSKV
jgi:hypothetical protein